MIAKRQNNCWSSPRRGKVQLISFERWCRARRSSNGITKGPSRVVLVQVCKQKPVVNVIVPRDLSAEAGQALTDLWCQVINRMSTTDGIQSNIDSCFSLSSFTPFRFPLRSQACQHRPFSLRLENPFVSSRIQLIIRFSFQSRYENYEYEYVIIWRVIFRN